MRIIFGLLILLFSLASKATLTTIYKAQNSKHTEFYQNYATDKLADGGFIINLKFSESGQLNREHIVTVDSNYSTLNWKFNSPITHLSIEAYRKGNKIFLSGTKNGTKTEKVFDVGDKPWFQIFPTGLSAFALSKNESQIYYSIGVEGPGELEIGEFIAKHIGTEKKGKDDTNAISLTFNNWKSTFWKGKSWHRKNDGRVMAIEVGRDIGTWELQSEKETK